MKRDKADFGFVWSSNATDISIPVTGTGVWNNIDLSAHIPTTATGAVVEIVNAGSTSNYSGVVRGTEDTNDYMSNLEFQRLYASSHRWQVVKVDSSQTIQGFIEHEDIDFKLLAYTIGSDPEYLTVPQDVTPGTTGDWATVNVSAHVDSDADGVILFLYSEDASARNYGIREIGSSYSTTDRKLGAYGNTTYLVGIDSSDQFQAYIENSNVRVYLMGQTKGSVVYNTNDVAVDDPQPADLGKWVDLDADDDVSPPVSSDANGLLCWAENTDAAGDHEAGFREGSSNDNWNKRSRESHPPYRLAPLVESA